MKKAKYTTEHMAQFIRDVDARSAKMSRSRACRLSGGTYAQYQYFKKRLVQVGAFSANRPNFITGENTTPIELLTLQNENARLKMALAELYLQRR